MISHAIGKTLAALSASVVLSAPVLATVDDDLPTPSTGLFMEYSGSVLIFQVAQLTINARLTEQDYSAVADFESAGLASWFDDTHIEANISGYIRDESMAPYRYEHTNHASSKGRIVGIDFPEGIATPDVTPPFSSMGEPPATEEERTGAIDPVSAILSLTIDVLNGADSCTGVREVFDGKARYNLRFESSGPDRVRTRAFNGDAEHCRAFLDPISGYDNDDRPTPEEVAKPIHVWLSEIDGHTVPVKFRADTQLGNVTISASRILVTQDAFTGSEG